MPSDTKRLTFGMLWRDDSDLPFIEKILIATDHYEEKYGVDATIVGVHPDEFEDYEIPGLQIVKSGVVQPDHFWIGQFEGKVAA